MATTRGRRVRSKGAMLGLGILAAGLVAARQPMDASQLAPVTQPAPDVERPFAFLSASVEPAEGGRHLGFDTHSYPGDRAMRAWRAADRYEWVGYYLPAPCHKDDSWSGTRQRLTDMGWGLAVIYVGQQWWEQPKWNTPAEVARAQESGATCLNQLLGAETGVAEAEDAVAKTAAEGFPRGTVIFLDIERMERMPEAMRDYYRAWTARVLADGRFLPGYYAHKHNAARIHADVKAIFDSAGVAAAPRFWIASGRSFSVTKAPYEVGHAFASAWQGVLDIVESRNGFKMPIDINVAHVPSPSYEYVSGD